MLSEGRREDRKLLLETDFSDCYSAVVSVFIQHRRNKFLKRIFVISNLYACRKSFPVVVKRFLEISFAQGSNGCTEEGGSLDF